MATGQSPYRKDADGYRCVYCGARGDTAGAVEDHVVNFHPTAGSAPTPAPTEEAPTTPPTPSTSREGRAAELDAMNKSGVYDVAQELDIPGRSSMSKGALIEAVLDAEAREA